MDKGKKPMLLEEEEEEPIHFPDTHMGKDDTTELILMGKLWTERSYNMYALIETMKKLWSPNKGLTIQELGSNLISFQFYSKRDMERIQSMQPWHFNKHILVLTQVSSEIQPSTLKFDKTSCWIRLYDVPIRGRNNACLNQIGTRFGEVLEVDETTTTGVARSVRMKILLNLSNSLKRGTKIKMGIAEPVWIPVTYERLPSFCYWCGKLGHTFKDCEGYYERSGADNEDGENTMPFGEWLKASPMKRIQLSTHNTSMENEKTRRSLFQKKEGTLLNRRFADEKEEEIHTETTQVSDLLRSLERVEVSDKEHRFQEVEERNHSEGERYLTIPANRCHQPTKPPNPHSTHHTTTTSKPPNTQPTPQNTQHTATTPKPPNTQPPPQNTQPPHHPSLHQIDPQKPQLQPQAHKPPQHPYPLPAPPQKEKLNLVKNPYIHPNLSGHYTPTEELIKMVINIADTTTTQNLPTRVKMEPTSPMAEQRKQEEKGKPSKWKRKKENQERKTTTGRGTEGKRKYESMAVDLESEGSAKRTQGGQSYTNISTAAVAEQPRRSS